MRADDAGSVMLRIAVGARRGGSGNRMPSRVLTDLVNLVDGDACWAEIPHVGGEGHEALQRAYFAPEAAMAAATPATQHVWKQR